MSLSAGRGEGGMPSGSSSQALLAGKAAEDSPGGAAQMERKQ